MSAPPTSRGASLLPVDAHGVDGVAGRLQDLEATSSWYQRLLANSSDLVIVLDSTGHLLYASPSNARLLGFAPGSLDGSDVFELIHPDDHDAAAAAFVSVLSHDGVSEPVVLRFRTATGEWRYVESVMTNCVDDPTIGGVVGNGRDVTERVFLVRALETLTDCNQVLVQATDETAFLSDVVRTIVETGGYPLAFVGFSRSDSAQTIEPVASYGRTAFLDVARLGWGTDEYSRGPTGLAVKTGVEQVIADLRTAPGTDVWRPVLEEFDLVSACVFPLRLSGQIIGSLTIYSDEVGAFRPTAVSTLRELAEDVAYGIARLREAAALRRNEELLHETQERFRLAFENNMAPMAFTDLSGTVLVVNEALCRLLGFARHEVLGRDWMEFLHPEDEPLDEEHLRRMLIEGNGEVRSVKRFIASNGRVLSAEVLKSPARDANGGLVYWVLSVRDITEERLLTEQLSRQALHDPLTGLANRALFDDRLQQARARSARTNSRAAVLLLDLDDFKGVNDAYGHMAGDELLRAIARRFEAVTRASDTLCRFGGDEFLYLAEGLSSDLEAATVAQRLLDALTEPFVVGGAKVEQHATIGIAAWDGESPDDTPVVQNADVALYEAKAQRPGGFTFFTPSMHQRALARFTMAQELRNALHGGELAMHFQPIVRLATASIVGFEALMRWQHPDRGPVPPSVFIPLAEQSDLIGELGLFALREAAHAAVGWTAAAGEDRAPFVTVNVSAYQFRQPDFCDVVEAVLVTSGLSSERLVLEITESVALLAAEDTIATIARLRQMGVSVALDDFGTGYSSLSYLVRLQPRIIKIDKYFVSPSVADEHHDALLATIVSLGGALEMAMIAEGIETGEQLARLQLLRCEFGQGFLFSPAVTADEAQRFLSGDTFASLV